MADSIPHGERLIPQIIDTTASATPARVYASLPHQHWRKYGWQDISWCKIAGAVNKLAWWLDEKIGTCLPFETIAYAGVSDLRYMLMVVAAIKTRRTVGEPDADFALCCLLDLDD